MVALAPFFFTHAEAPDAPRADGIQSELGRLTESLDLLTAIKAGKRPTDATSLQTALNDVLRLSEEEVRSVSVRLAAQDGLTDEEKNLQEKLVADLAGLKLQIKSVRMDATQEAGPSAVTSIARQFKEWRDGQYAATIGEAAAFVGAFENGDAVKAANARLGAILKDEKKIRSLLPALKTAPFMRLIKKAQGELKKAADLNARAKAALIPDPDTAGTAEDGDSADGMASESNALVNAAYDDFIAMSKLIKK